MEFRLLNWHKWYLEDADSYSTHFWANLNPFLGKFLKLGL